MSLPESQPRALDDAEAQALSCFGPTTYSVFLGRDVAKRLEEKGLVEWVPPMFGGISWRLTEAGEKYRRPAA